MHLGLKLGESRLSIARGKLGGGGIQKERTNRLAGSDAHSRGQESVELTHDSPTPSPFSASETGLWL